MLAPFKKALAKREREVVLLRQLDECLEQLFRDAMHPGPNQPLVLVLPIAVGPQRIQRGGRERYVAEAGLALGVANRPPTARRSLAPSDAKVRTCRSTAPSGPQMATSPGLATPSGSSIRR